MDLCQFDLKPLKLSDRHFIDSILRSNKAMLSAYNFAAHYIWRDIFHFHWGIIDGHLCLFAQYGDYLYMPVPPILLSSPPVGEDKGRGEGFSKIIARVFDMMEMVNHNKAISRIENIDESQIEAFTSLGYGIRPGEGEYVYLREDLAGLQGDRYKAKRALCNHFTKHYRYTYEPFQSSFTGDCMKLYDKWKLEKVKKSDDPFYRALLDDAYFAHHQAMRHHKSLQLTGRVVRFNGRIAGYTFGFARDNIFYTLLEVANPDIKGLAQFIFREFCREMGGHTYINTLGDSGLESLRKVKQSYRPCKIVPSYIAYLPDEMPRLF